METIFGGKAGGVFFCASDIAGWWGIRISSTRRCWRGWRLRLRRITDLAGLRRVVENRREYQVSRMFSAPTAIRVLKKFLPLKFANTISRRWKCSIWLETAGRADRQLGEQYAGCAGHRNYWQTESGWPIMAIARGLDAGRRVWEAPACRCMAITCSCQ